MDVLFELSRVFVSTVSRRCAATILEVASTHPTYRPALIRVGNATNKVYVHLKYASGQLLNKSPDAPKVTLNVKPLEDDVALGVGAETVSDSMVMLLMVSFVFTGIIIKRHNSAAAAAAAAKVSETLRAEQERLKVLLEEQHRQVRRLGERLDALEVKMGRFGLGDVQKIELQDL